MEHVYVQMWMSLPKEIRHQLIKDFNIERTGPAEIRDEHVITDGYTNSDLRVFTSESMEKYVGAPATFMRLWEITIAKARSIVNPPQVEVGVGVIDSPIQVSPETLEVAPSAKFCDSCDSKAVRHKNDCPKAKNYKTYVGK